MLRYTAALASLIGIAGDYDAHVTSFGEKPVISFLQGNTEYQQTFNPAWIQASAGYLTTYLFVVHS